MKPEIDMYREGLISLDDLAERLITIGGKDWAKDAMSIFLNDEEYDEFLKAVNEFKI